MDLSLEFTEMLIAQHQMRLRRSTQLNLGPKPGKAFEGQAFEDIIEDVLGRWLEAADRLSLSAEARQIWAYTMRPWLDTILRLGGHFTPIENGEREAILERLIQYWDACQASRRR